LEINIKSVFISLGLVVILAVPSGLEARELGPVEMEDVAIEPSGAWRLETGFDWETGRTLATNGGSDLDFDNIRFHPLDLRYGYNKWLEFGAGLGYSINSEDNRFGAADESGFEGLSFSGKIRWNKNVATSLELGFLGSDEVFPFSADGFNIGFNIPAQVALGPGRVTGELGFTVQTGDAAFPRPGGGGTADRESYLNYALGYVYDVNRSFSLTSEIRGNGETVEDGESMLEYSIGVPIRWNQASTFEPVLSAGISDGSPDFAIGFDWNWNFGRGQRYVKSQDDDRRNRQQGGVLGRDSDRRSQSDDPLVLPREERSSPRKSQQSRNSKRTRPSSEEKQAQQTGSDQLEVPKRTEQKNKQNQQKTGQITSQSSQKTQASQQQASQQKENPGQAARLATRAREAFDQGNYTRAIGLYEKAAKLDPNNVEYQSNLGSLHYRQDNYSKARDHYRKALRIDSEDYFSHLYLGATLFRMGNKSKARQHFQRVLEIQPNNQQAQRWLDRLDKQAPQT